jgi:D-xylose transport system permease protein
VTNLTGAAPVPSQTEPSLRSTIRGLIAQTEIDLRTFGMLLALGLVLLLFQIRDGTFIRPTNMVTLAVQAAGVAIIATGMVLVIVSRNIDLSVGSLVGLIAMTYALLMTDWMPNLLGMGAEFPFRWAIALALGVGLGALVGALQGFIIAYVGVPSFIVTLGGLLSIRGVIWYLSRGAAVSGLDPNFQLLGGGAAGSIGGTLTWGLGVVSCVAIVALLFNGRRGRRRFGFPLRPLWAEAMIGVVACAAVLGLSAFANANLWPKSLTGGQEVSTGYPFPIILLLGVTLVMTWLATRRRFGRYVYAFGGNPDAADLAGINTRLLVLKTYVLMGVLCALAAAIAAARLNGSTLDVGQSYELYVIAAAVVGGTSFAGGIGTIPGAVLGGVFMQTLAYGLSYAGVDSPGQNVVAGIVLILAVGIDSFNRRHAR